MKLIEALSVITTEIELIDIDTLETIAVGSTWSQRDDLERYGDYEVMLLFAFLHL